MGKTGFSPEEDKRNLLEDMGRRGLLGRERQPQAMDDPVDDRLLCEERDDLHPPRRLEGEVS
jgi:hypothetical protein